LSNRMGKKDRKERKLNAREKHEQKVRRNQQNNAANDESTEQDKELEKQLRQVGLALRDTTADGNCLFRAVSDQIWGSEVHHTRIRQDCVKFMSDNEEDFKPFIDGEFDAFLRETSTLGEFAGNEALVAIARKFQVEIQIHQAGQAVWTVSDSSRDPERQIHLAYHDWEHYSSIRKVGDVSDRPACLFLNYDKSADVREVFLEFDDDEREVTIIEEKSTPKPKLSHKDKKREKKLQKMREKADRARLKKEGPRVITIEDDIDEIASKSIQRLQI